MTPALSSLFSANRLPADALIVRVPPRRLENAQADRLQYGFFMREAGQAGESGFSRLPDLPRSGETVLLLAAEDVLLADATVPPLSSSRLREALPHLMEDRILTDVSRLHVARVNASGRTRLQALAAVDRAWLARVLERFRAAGHRVRWVLPESLCIPLAPERWTLACLPGPSFCLRTGPHQALALPDEPESMALLLQAMLHEADTQPVALKVHAAQEQMPEVLRVLETVAPSSLVIETVNADPIRQYWNDAAAQTDFSDHPQTLLQHEFAPSLFDASQWRSWRRVALLAGALLAVQLLGMQMHWAQLRAERSELRQQAASLLRAAFPATTTILDAPLQMERGLADLRARAGQRNPGDFTALLDAAGQIFADAPANSLRGLEYGASPAERGLRLRMTLAAAGHAEQQATWIRRAAAAGYDLRFENPGEPGAPVSPLQASAANRSAGEIMVLLRARSESS